VWGWEQPWQIKEYPVPEPAPGALLIKLTLANICGSDLHLWQSDLRAIRTASPRQWGHEGTGRVAALGEGVTVDSAGAPLARGDRVVFSHFFPCGRCRACLRADDRLCIHRRDMMLESCDIWPHFRGTFGDYYYLFPHHTVLKVPDSLSDELVAGINCAMSQVICGWETAGIKLGDNIVIQGAGGLGIYSIAVARERGAGRIISIDQVPERLELARSFGADEVIDMREYPTPALRIQRVKELTDGWGADAVMEVVGVPQAVDEGIHMVGQGGRYVEIGNVSAGNHTYLANPEEWTHGNITIYGNNNWGRRHLQMALDMLIRTRDRYPYHRIISHKFALAEINEAMEQQAQGHITRASLVP
jgi:threonine dehydrogenase-like Zn-dependent dehydrogenase